MRLRDFLSDQQMTEADFAASVDLSRETINRLKNGVVWPSRATAEKIATATQGLVTPNDFLGITPPATADHSE